MAIQRPYNINLLGRTIDAKESNIITWSLSGDISVFFQVKIYKNSDNSLVYDSTKISSYAQSFTLPTNTLANGNEYKIQVTVWNDKNESATSDYVVFQTSSRPVVTVDSIPVVRSSSYNFSANYSQAESVPIQSWIAYLYDSNKVKIAQSPIKTTSTLEYIFTDLQSEKDYYIEFQVTSEKTLVGTSGLIKFSVLYTRPLVNALLTAENVDNAGIKLSFHVIQIIGKTDCNPVTYIDNEKIDLRNCRMWFDEGFSLSSNFTIKIWLENPPNREDLFILKGDNGEIRLQYHILDECFHLYRKILNITSEWTSQPVNGGNYFVCIRQIGSDMDIVAEMNA